MKTALKPKKEPPKPAKRRVNTWIDAELAELFKSYCRQNRKARNVSHMVEDAMIAAIRNHGRRYGLQLPEHLAA